MDITELRGLSTIFCMVAFLAVVYWAYGPSRKQYFDEAASLPFAEEQGEQQGAKQQKDESS